jgi:hypothetical protein
MMLLTFIWCDIMIIFGLADPLGPHPTVWACGVSRGEEGGEEPPESEAVDAHPC